MSEDVYKNTTVRIFYSYKNAMAFSKKVNGKLTITKHGKYKVRYVHSEILSK